MSKLTELIQALNRIAAAIERVASIYETIAKEEQLWTLSEKSNESGKQSK